MLRAPCLRRPLHHLRGDSLARLRPGGRISILEARRDLVTLAIESSCDDTSVAVLEKDDATGRAVLHFHDKVTVDSREFQGINPKTAVISHEQSLAPLLQRALAHLPLMSPSSHSPSRDSGTVSSSPPSKGVMLDGSLRKLDFVCATRGPGMRSSVATGLSTAKGLALGFGVPLVGVHHMQAHALTPRLVSALNKGGDASDDGSSSSSPTRTAIAGSSAPAVASNPTLTPELPFLSLLVSGGHTMILHSESLTSHRILSETVDIAAGDALDKMARHILPEDVLERSRDVSYGRVLEEFVFGQDGSSATPVDYASLYSPPASRAEEVQPRKTAFGWSLPVPFSSTRGGQRAFDPAMSFTGLYSATERLVKTRNGPARDERDAAPARPEGFSLEERKLLGFEAMRVAFEHIASRVVMCLDAVGRDDDHAAAAAATTTTEERRPRRQAISTLVASGGVAANGFLRHVLRRVLDAKGHAHVRLEFPPLALCTDNAAMVAWAGVEMYQAGWHSDLACLPLRKWSLDPDADDGGILGVGGWKRR